MEKIQGYNKSGDRHPILYRWTVAFFLFCPVTLLAGYFAILDPDFLHDGFLLKTAMDVSSGMTLFKDTYTQYGALTVGIQALAISIFGPKVIVLRLLTAVFYGFIAVVLYKVNRRIMENNVALVSVTIWVILAPYYVSPLYPWSSVYALLFLLLGVLVLLDSLNQQLAYKFFVSGTLLTLAFWFRQPTGIVFAAIFAYLVFCLLDNSIDRRNALRNLLFFGIGFLICNAIFLGIFIYNNSLVDWWKQSIYGAYLWAKDYPDYEYMSNIFELAARLVIPNLYWRGPGNVSFIWSIFPLVSIFWITFLVVKMLRKRELALNEHAVLIVATASVASWHQYLPRADIDHVYWAATPMIGLTVWSFWNLLGSIREKLLRVVLVIIVLVFLLGEEASFRYESALGKKERAPLKMENLSGMYITKSWLNRNNPNVSLEEYTEEVAKVGDLFLAIRKYDKEIALVNLTEDVYSLTELHGDNPHKVFVDWLWLRNLYEERDSYVKSFIKKRRPLLEVSVQSDWANESHPLRKEYGISDYYVLAELNYTFDGAVQILAPPEFMDTYLPK